MEYGSSTSNSDTVTVRELVIPTALTLVGPATAAEGTAFTLSGVLTRSDTKVGVANQTIQLQVQVDGQFVNIAGATATTESDGFYSIIVTESAGSYVYKTAYAGGSTGDLPEPEPRLLWDISDHKLVVMNEDKTAYAGGSTGDLPEPEPRLLWDISDHKFVVMNQGE